MGFWNGISSVVSAASSLISSASSILGSLASSASTFLKVAAPWIGTVIQVIEIVSMFIDVLKPGDNVAELGAKAMEADKKLEDFDTNAEYIDYLRSEVQLDKEKFDSATESEKMAQMAVGATIVTKGIEEKKGFDIPLSTWVAIAKVGLADKANEIDKILDTFKEGNLEDFVSYTDGKLDAKKEIEVGDSLVEMYKELEPNMSEKEIEDKVMKMDIGGRP